MWCATDLKRFAIGRVLHWQTHVLDNIDASVKKSLYSKLLKTEQTLTADCNLRRQYTATVS